MAGRVENDAKGDAVAVLRERNLAREPGARPLLLEWVAGRMFVLHARVLIGDLGSLDVSPHHPPAGRGAGRDEAGPPALPGPKP
jgi:hypothetical protein